MATTVCPTLMPLSNGDMCQENFAGLGSYAYFFALDDIDKSKLVADKNVYAWTDEVLKSGKVFYKAELKEDSQSLTGESQGNNKGFQITGQLIVEAVNEKVAQFLRALNNIKWGVIIPDGDNAFQILYSPTRKIKLDSGALKTETGAAASDDRQSTIAPVLGPVTYANYYVTFPEGKDPESYCTSPMPLPENKG